ncbi:MAG: hypothetical protein GXY77_16090 [Fibrobacter sp.]|nr:hypothetical protein [Fibrobacter sp.]
MAIDFTKVQKDVASKAETIPTNSLKPTESTNKATEKRMKPSKGEDPKKYTRIGFDPDVWQAMKVKKLMNDENFTNQINNALRMYLGLKN